MFATKMRFVSKQRIAFTASVFLDTLGMAATAQVAYCANPYKMQLIAKQKINK